jgi:hypothetical protein
MKSKQGHPSPASAGEARVHLGQLYLSKEIKYRIIAIFTSSVKVRWRHMFHIGRKGLLDYLHRQIWDGIAVSTYFCGKNGLGSQFAERLSRYNTNRET